MDEKRFAVLIDAENVSNIYIKYILDEISTFEALGKTPGKDKASGKLTYVSLFGLENAKCKLACLFDECYDILNKHDIKSEIFTDIIEGIRQRVKL